MNEEYPIDDEFWKWWNSYWEKIDISFNLGYNKYRKEKEKENPENGIARFHERSLRLEDSTRG